MSKKRKRGHDGAEKDAVLQKETGFASSEDEDTPSDASSASDSSSGRHLCDGDRSVVLHKKIAQGTKHMIRAFKKAKTFEVRKIIKRIKTAKYGIS